MYNTRRARSPRRQQPAKNASSRGIIRHSTPGKDGGDGGGGGGGAVRAQLTKDNYCAFISLV